MRASFLLVGNALPFLCAATQLTLLHLHCAGAPHIILKLVQVDQEEVAKRVNWKVSSKHGGRHP